MRRALILLVSLGLLVAGCAVDEQPAVELPPLTLPAPLESTFSGSCSDSRLLEAWLQTAFFQYEEFVLLLNAAPDKTSDELYADVSRMSDIRNAVSVQAVPDCAVTGHTRLLEAMDAVIPALARFVNGESVDVAAQAEAVQPTLTAFLEQHVALSERLETQYRGGR